MSRALRSTVSDLLGQPRLRGPELLTALEEAGRSHGAEPFEACLTMLPLPMRSAAEPRKIVAGIETHRSGLEQRLGRDPGFVVAAMDFLQGVDGRATDSGASFEERLGFELRRCRRSRRPLSLLLLVPGDLPGREPFDRAEAALVEAVRDTDLVGRLLPPAFAVALPESAAAAARRAAVRLSGIAARASGLHFGYGLAVAGDGDEDGARLLRAARIALHREPDRRRHRRRAAGGVRARLLCGDASRDIRVLDLSPGGARIPDDALPEGAAVRLSLSGPSPRADSATVPARVAARRASPEGDQAILVFDDDDPAMADLAALLSGLPRGPREGQS